MISSKRYWILLILFNLKMFKTQRKISAGVPVTSEKGFVVYLTKASKSDKLYDYWICGGALVSKLHIVTSAACVQDVEYMYAIAGYSKYVQPNKIDSDKCTSAMKKKVVYTCVPRSYVLDYAKVEKWSFIDIAVLKVESAYDFNDSKFLSLCSYKPRAITVNYDKKYQDPDTDSLVFGWGHVQKWRRPEDTRDYNQDMLHYAATSIYDKKECKKAYSSFPSLMSVIDKYMICTLEKGHLDEEGKQAEKPMLVDGCTPNLRLLAAGEIECEEDETILLEDGTRKSSNNWISRMMHRQMQTRREGFCQNDHGGPLVTWIGAEEALIGVASVFRVTSDSQCTGPYLYTSTQCNGVFLDCVINGNNGSRRTFCEGPPSETGFDKIERHISWKFHPDGSAENENNDDVAIDDIKLRPMRPIRSNS